MNRHGLDVPLRDVSYVHFDVIMNESEVDRIRALLAATGEATSIAAFIAVGAVHYIEDCERLIQKGGAK